MLRPGWDVVLQIVKWIGSWQQNHLTLWPNNNNITKFDLKCSIDRVSDVRYVINNPNCKIHKNKTKIFITFLSYNQICWLWNMIVNAVVLINRAARLIFVISFCNNQSKYRAFTLSPENATHIPTQSRCWLSVSVILTLDWLDINWLDCQTAVCKQR